MAENTLRYSYPSSGVHDPLRAPLAPRDVTPDLVSAAGEALVHDAGLSGVRDLLAEVLGELRAIREVLEAQR